MLHCSDLVFETLVKSGQHCDIPKHRTPSYFTISVSVLFSSASISSCVPGTVASLARIFQGCSEAFASLACVSPCVGPVASSSYAALQSIKSQSLSLSQAQANHTKQQGCIHDDLKGDGTGHS